MTDQAQRDRVLALAGAFQAVSLVDQVARRGTLEPEPFSASVASVLRLDSDSTAAIFGGPRGVRHGLEVLCRQLGDDPEGRDLELTRYWVSLLFLERKLVRRQDLVAVIRSGLEALAERAGHGSAVPEAVLGELAALYQRTLSTLSPRILVSGEPEYLRQERNAARIRVLLLAAMRATVLWRRLGGNRLTLLLARRRLVAAARGMLDQLAQG